MSEDEAQDWVIAHFGAAGHAKLAALAALVAREAAQQNLIAPSTIDVMWSRHLVDSAQLIGLAADRARAGVWLDIGSGAGFPGLVVALLTDYAVVLVESRRKRSAFLTAAADALGIAARTQIQAVSADRLSIPAAVLSARAVASLDILLELGAKCATHESLWVLPKGQSAREEVATVRATWHGMFHVEQSITDPQSLIVLASGVSRR